MRLVIKRPSVLLGELQFEYIGIQMKNVSFCSFVKMFILSSFIFIFTNRNNASCGARDLVCCGMWYFPRPGMKPVHWQADY